MFLRTRVPPAERVVSVAVVCLLAAIAVAIFIEGKHYDPNLFSVSVEALKTTTAGKSSGPLASSDTGEEAGTSAETGATSSSAAPAKGEPLDLKLAGLEPMGATEFYGPDNLFEKIDGRAPAYIGFNFQELRCRFFAVVGSKGSFVDVFEYFFDTPINAFGMFALERDPKGGPLDFAPDGYSGDMGYYFRQGRCYVQVIASDKSAAALAKAIARNRAQVLPADDAGLDARRRLPAAGLIPESVSFVLENAQGQAFLKNVFQATYNFEGRKLPFFLMVTTPPEAAAAWKAYQDFCDRIGGKVAILPGANGGRVFRAETFGTWKVIYQRDGEIGGVFDAEDGQKAQQFVEEYLQGRIQ
jgi:hypothetical protein